MAKNRKLDDKDSFVVCPNRLCVNNDPKIAAATGMIRTYGSYVTRNGKVRRYKCVVCGTTFTERTGKPNWHMRYDQYSSEDMYDQYVGGMKVSDIARVNSCTNGVVRTRLASKRRRMLNTG